ncbi:MAG: threonylcarbamoyl-AMP synthase [Roseburia sp.]|nr:threonylcarbamoyl-AMP synthase [Roseburia sp.]
MQTKLIRIDSEHIDIVKMREAATLIREGELVAFPTETVYGLGADALRPEASAKIYEAKGRPSDNPLIVHICRFEELERIAKIVPEQARKLAEAFWPGPLTMVVWKNEKVPYTTTGGMDTVAVRMPNHPVALSLIAESGCLIAAPSANTSGKPSPTEAGHVADDMDGRIPMILDGGAVGIGIESTIVDLTEEKPMILRPGYITKQMLEEVLGEEVIIDPGILATDTTDPSQAGQKPKAPGMRYKHYAPKADLVLVEGDTDKVVVEINNLVEDAQIDGKRVGVIATDETMNRYKADVVFSIGARDDEDAIAQHLYKILREFDEQDVDAIYSESFKTPRIGQAIMNRLLKAAGYQVLYV